MKVFDFSAHNRILDWNLIKQDCDAVILRCGYRGYGSTGRLMKDAKFEEYRAKCKELGIPYGVYFFPTSITELEAVREADFVYSLVGNDKLAFPIFADSEIAETKNKSGRSDRLSKADRTKYLLAFLHRLGEYGLRGGVYASTSWYKDRLDDMQLLKYPHWVAQYGKACKYSGDKIGWQYTSTYSLPGAVAKPFDCSEFYLHLSTPIAIATPTLSIGAKGDNVRTLQRNLQMCGYTIDADGSFGRITESTLRNWQRSNELVDDGIYGRKSHDKMVALLS